MTSLIIIIQLFLDQLEPWNRTKSKKRISPNKTDTPYSADAELGSLANCSTHKMNQKEKEFLNDYEELFRANRNALPESSSYNNPYMDY